MSTILSSHYFPCIAYFALLLKEETTLIDLGAHFIKQSYRNRCVIYSANGKLALSIPVLKKNKTSLKEVLLDSKSDWRKSHWKSISSAYNSSPFFEFYEDDLKEVFFSEYKTLAELNTALLKHLCKEIKLCLNLEFSNEYVNTTNSLNDYREALDAKKTYLEAENYPRYIQIFEEKHGFIKNLSILDLLFHEGPETLNYLKKLP